MTVNFAASLNLKRVKEQEPDCSSSPGVAVVFSSHEGSSEAPAFHPSRGLGIRVRTKALVY